MISDIIRLVTNILSGPTDAAEDCKTLQNILVCMEKGEKDTAQGRVIWEATKVREKVLGLVRECMDSLMQNK